MRLRLLLLCALFFSFGFSQVSAKSYEIPTIEVEVTINKDGTIRITEKLTYDFDGSFSWADYKLPKKGFSSISDIRVSEGPKAYVNENSEKPGTFSVAKSDDAIQIKWHYSAEDEQRTFTISYTLDDAIVIGPQWSEFFWNYLSDSRDKSTNHLNIDIILPQSVSTDSLYGWTRSTDGEVNLQKRAGGYSATAPQIDNDESLKVKTVFPTRIFNQKVSVTNSDFTLASAEKDEERYREQLAQQKQWEAYWTERAKQTNYLIAILSVAFFYLVYRKYGKRHSTSHLSSTESIVIPDQSRPSAIGWLLSNRTITSSQILGAVLDLARRGYFKIQEKPPEEGFLKDDEPTFAIERTKQPLQDDLLNWEKEIILFVEQQIENDTTKLHEIFKSNSSKVSSWFSDWKQHFKEYCFDLGWVDLKSYTGVYWNLGLQLALFSAVIGVLIYTGPLAPISLITAFATTFIGSFLSLAIIRRTPEGEEIYHRWENYKEALENAQDYTLKSDVLDKHFINAVVLGIDQDEIEQLFTSAPDQVHAFAWIVLMSNTSHSASTLASTFSTLGATGTTSFAGTSAGTGASAGTAGGGASASAG